MQIITTIKKKLEIFSKSRIKLHYRHELIYQQLNTLLFILRRNFGDIEVEIFFDKFEWDYKRDVYNSDNASVKKDNEEQMNPDYDEKAKVNEY